MTSLILSPRGHRHGPLITFTFTYSTTARVIGTPKTTSQPISSTFSVLHCPLGLSELQACPFPDVVFPPLFLPCLLPPFTVPCKMVSAKPDEQETCLHHCSLRLFIVRSLCGLIALSILAQTFSLVA